MTCEIITNTKTGKRTFRESFQVPISTTSILKSSVESFDPNYVDLPSKIYPHIRAINANTITRNNTYYPTESLIGDPIEGSGYRSAVYPYPIPVIKDHLSSPDKETGFASPIYGRVSAAKFIADGSGGGYTAMVPEISDPEAIFGILNELWLTVSIGVTSEELYCGLCGADLIQVGPGGCGHIKGESYEINGKTSTAFWKIGPVFHQELSIVVVPSDPGAQIEIPDIGKEGLKLFKESGFTRPSLASNNKEEFCMNKLTLGTLFSLAEEHPDFHTESTLSTKQRDSLSDSVFCGPNRSFPAPDVSHAAYGLSVLDSYKGDGDKNEIKACLKKRLSSFKKGKESLVVLSDPKTQITVPLLDFSGDIPEMLAKLDKFNFSEAETARVMGLIAYHGLKAGLKLPPTLESVTPAKTGTCVTVEVNSDTFPLLYHVLESVSAPSVELLEHSINQYEANQSAALAESEQVISELRASIKDLEKALAEKIVEAAGVETSTIDESLKEKDTQLIESLAVVEALKAQNVVQAESIQALQENSVQLETDRHNSLALNVAVLKKLARRRTAIQKDVNVLAQEAAKRTRASLLDEYTELLEEVGGLLNAGVATVATESIANPVLTESSIEVDLATGHPVISNQITETDEGTYLIGLVDPKSVARRAEQERSRFYSSR